jgi:hypothetical protein
VFKTRSRLAATSGDGARGRHRRDVEAARLIRCVVRGFVGVGEERNSADDVRPKISILWPIGQTVAITIGIWPSELRTYNHLSAAASASMRATAATDNPRIQRPQRLPPFQPDR